MVKERTVRSVIKNILKYFLYFFCLPVTIILLTLIFNDRQYVLISVVFAIFICAAFFAFYEKKQDSANKTVILAVLIALSVTGRTVFYLLPNFKPVTAIIIITGMYLGFESGFISGALSAVISNMVFGQGPWTPFQMLSWGLIGAIAALLSKLLKKNIIWLLLYSVLSALIYSLIMDFWTTISIDSQFNFSRYLILIITAAPATITHAISNVIFLSFLHRPIANKLNRIQMKYGL